MNLESGGQNTAEPRKERETYNSSGEGMQSDLAERKRASVQRQAAARHTWSKLCSA